MMEELLRFFLGAVHIFVVDPLLLPMVDAVCCVICVTMVLGTACVIIVTAFRLVFRSIFSDRW